MCKILPLGGFCLSGKWLVPLRSGIIKDRQNLLAGYKEQKTKMRLQKQLLGSSLQTEEIKDGAGWWIFLFFFSYLSGSVSGKGCFNICTWFSARCLHHTACTRLKSHKWLFQSNWSPCRWWRFVEPQHSCLQDLPVTQVAATSRSTSCSSLLLLHVVAPQYVAEWWIY